MTSLGLSEVLTCKQSGIPRIREALALAIESGEVEAVGRAWLNLVLGYRETGELDEGLAAADQGIQATRDMGALSFEVILASQRSILLMERCRFDEAESLCRELLGSRRSVLTPPAFVFTGLALVPTLVRQGRLPEASISVEDFLPVARRIGHGMFLVPMLVAQSELEEARGNFAAAALCIQEAVSLVLAGPATAHLFTPLVQASRLLERKLATSLLDRCRIAATYPRLRAAVLEASGILDDDKASLLEASSLYRDLGFRYQQARALAAAGDDKQAREGCFERWVRPSSSWRASNSG